MRQKVNTVMDSALLQRLRAESALQQRDVSEILDDALTLYLQQRGSYVPSTGAVAGSWSAVPLDAALVQSILSEEDGLLESGGG